MKKFLKTCLFAGVFASQAVTSFGTSAMNQGSGLYDELSSAVEEKEKNPQSEVVKNEETNEKKVGDNASNSNNSTNNNAATETKIVANKSAASSNDYVYVNNNPPISAGHAVLKYMVPFEFIASVAKYLGDILIPGGIKKTLITGFCVPFTIFSMKDAYKNGYANSGMQKFVNFAIVNPYIATKDFFGLFIVPNSLNDKDWKSTKAFFNNKGLASTKTDELGNSIAGLAAKDEIWYTFGMMGESFKGIGRGVGRIFSSAAYVLNKNDDISDSGESIDVSPRPDIKYGRISPSKRPSTKEGNAIFV